MALLPFSGQFQETLLGVVNFMVERRRAEVTGAQIRAARGLLNLSIEGLADDTKLSLKTIRRAERYHGTVQINAANAEQIVAALEKRGACFIAVGDGGVGVRLRIEPPPQFGEFKTMKPKSTSTRNAARKV
jgi:hypothetical protein